MQVGSGHKGIVQPGAVTSGDSVVPLHGVVMIFCNMHPGLQQPPEDDELLLEEELLDEDDEELEEDDEPVALHIYPQLLSSHAVVVSAHSGIIPLQQV